MQLQTMFTAIIGFATAQAVSAICTTTILPTGIACCPPIAGATSTSFIDCNNCAIETAPTPSCRAICESPVPTALDLTTTLTACAPSATPFETLAVRATTTCASTTTKWANPCGDCGHVYAATKTASVDCDGCGALVTVTSINSDAVGICVCPTGDVTTKEVCAAGATPE